MQRPIHPALRRALRRTAAVSLASLLSFGATAAMAQERAGIIDMVDHGKQTISVGDRSYRMDANLEVRGKSGRLAPRDLRPGQSVQISVEHRGPESIVRSIRIE